MPTQQPGGRSPLYKRGPRRTETTYLMLGVVFVVVGVGLYFGDSSAGLPFLMVGITFLILSGDSRAKQRKRDRDDSHQD